MEIPFNKIYKDDHFLCDHWLDNPLDGAFYSDLEHLPSKEINKHVLVTNQGDWSITLRNNFYFAHDANRPFWSIKKPSLVHKWFSTNMNVYNENTEFLPLGTLQGHLDIIDEKIQKIKPDRKTLLYINFGIRSTYRLLLKQYINKNLMYFSCFAKIEWPPPEGTKKEIYQPFLYKFFDNLLTSKFILCPPSNGIDTYRMYEAMYCGCIPILMKMPFTEHLKEYPLLIINNLNELNKEFLEKEYYRISNSKFNFEILTKSYHINRIKNAINNYNM